MQIVEKMFEGNLKISTHTGKAAYGLLGEDVAVIHIKDYIVENGRVCSVGAGMGQMDYSSLMQFIKRRKPYIHATLEDTTPQNCLQCKEYIESIYSAY